MADKYYIDANTLLEDSFRLARQIYDSDFKPTVLVALWRGGTPIGIAIQEGLSYLGIQTKHLALRTSYYDHNNNRKKHVQIDNLGAIAEQLKTEDHLLLVDDVFDSGNTIAALVAKIQSSPEIQAPANIKIATPYFKPKNNQTNIKPDFYLHETDQWIVFPHELHGLSDEEIKQYKPMANSLI